ncbi:hypothetical protein Q9189_005714 [Teloschistes chrysophthalmus]
MAIQDPGFWDRFSIPTHHDEHTSKEPVTLVQIASTSSTRSRPDFRDSTDPNAVRPPPLHRPSFLEYQASCHRRSKRRLIIGGLLLVAATTVVTIVMVWLGVNGWFGGR